MKSLKNLTRNIRNNMFEKTTYKPNYLKSIIGLLNFNYIQFTGQDTRIMVSMERK